MNGWQRREAGSAQQNKTPHIYLQADSRTYSPQQLFEHELFHSVVAANKGLWSDIVDHLYQTHTQEEIVRMVDAYVQAYDGCYGTEEADAEKYLEEIFADVYAEMQRGGGQQRAARELAGETAQRFAGDIENARQNRAGIENRNGPGTRLAFSDVRIPSYEELIQKDPVTIVDIPSPEKGKSYAQQRTEFKESAKESGFYNEPVINKDTQQLCFVVPSTLTHIYSNIGSEQ